MSAANPWLDEVEATLPRLLALFDVDALSQTWGQGDRLFWAWKLKDFGNATFQGAAHGLARLSRAGLLPEGMTPGAIQRRIESLFIGARRLTRGNGSLEEAFPYESSFCVTALVAWDLLSAVQLLQSQVSPEQRCDWLDTVAPMIGFLLRNDETHALISNHLATAVAALVLWDELVEDADPAVARRGRQLLDRILDNASDEGWFREYDGADPGYQSLAMHYLAEVDALPRPGGSRRGWPPQATFSATSCTPTAPLAAITAAARPVSFIPGASSGWPVATHTRPRWCWRCVTPWRRGRRYPWPRSTNPT